MRNWIVCFIVLGITSGLFSQEVSVRSDKYKIKIGEAAYLKLNARVKKGERVIWPQVSDSIGPHFDVVERAQLDTLSDSTGTGISIEQQLQITSFDSGMHTMPVFDFQFIRASGDTESVITDAIGIEVLTVAVDTTKAIKDIKDVVDVPFDFSEYIPWVLGGLIGAAILVAGIYIWLRRKKPEKPAIPVEKRIPAWQRAFAELDRIEKEQLWQNGKEKAYHSGISDTLRAYIEEDYNLPALESTSDEILIMWRKQPKSEDSLNCLRQILSLADLVKFAKEKPLPAEHERSLSLARTFIELTKPVAATDLNSTTGKEPNDE
jgi:hypothetical protein